MTTAPVNEPQFSQDQAVRVKEEGTTDAPPRSARGKAGVIEAYAGWFGTGSTFPVKTVHHQYFVRVDDHPLPHVITEDWLEPAQN